MKKQYVLPLVVASSLTLTGCWLDDDDDPAATATANVRVLHASPDAPAVNIAIDGTVVLNDVEFQQGSGYLKVGVGQRNVSILSGSTKVYEETFTLEEGKYYSVLAQGELSSIDLEVLDDSDRRANGSIDVTVVHASPNAGNVDVYATAPGVDPLPSAPALGDVPFGANATLADQAAGNYQVRLTPPATPGNVVYDSGSVAVAGDVTLVAVDSNKGLSPASLLAWSESTPPVAVVLDDSAEVRIVHAVDNVDVDVFVGGVELLGDFSYKTVNDYLEVGSGDLEVAIAAANQGVGNAIPSLTDTLTLDRGESYTVIAAGDVNDLPGTQLIVLLDERAFDTSSEAKVRLVHAASAPAADPVDIFVFETGGAIPVAPTFPDVTFGQDTGYVSLPAPEDYDVVIAADGTNTPAVPGTAGITLGTGGVLTAIAIGNQAANLEALTLDDLR